MTNIFKALQYMSLILLLLQGATPALAQESRTERVSFPRGQTGTGFSNSIQGDEIVEYLVGASAGQRIAVEMSTSNPSSYFNVTAPGASAAMHTGSTSGNNFQATLPSSGDYRIMVYLMRNAARRGETANYSLDISVTGNGSAAAPSADFADGLAGGPDFWEVTGVASNDRLNVRTRPSTSGSIVVRIRNGTVVRNEGCRMSGSQRWCRIEVHNGRGAGWVAGRFLREASVYPGQQPGPPAQSTGQGGVPEIIAGTNGEAEVIFQNNCVVYFNARGRRTKSLPACRQGQKRRAADAIARYRREQGLD